MALHGTAIHLLQKTSSLFQTVTGCGAHEPRLMEDAPRSHPTWLARTMGPFSSEAVLTYMKRISTDPLPNIDALFHFYHADLGPMNIMISEKGSVVTGIIGWESGAYYPRFWIATKPAVSSVYWLEPDTDQPELWGQLLLTEALKVKGFESSDTIFRPWLFGIFFFFFCIEFTQFSVRFVV